MCSAEVKPQGARGSWESLAVGVLGAPGTGLLRDQPMGRVASGQMLLWHVSMATTVVEGMNGQ